MKHFIYSIHTFECQLQLTKYNYHTLVNDIYTKAKNTYRIVHKGNHLWICLNPPQGLLISLHRTDFGYYCIHIVVNPKTILDPKNICNIFNPETDSLDTVFKKVNEMLSFMGNLYRIENFELTRIDLCIDVKCKDDTTVEEYIRLAKKGILPYGYQDKLKLLKHTKKKINHKFSFDIVNKQGAQITLYNKYQQLLNIKTPENLASKAYGTLRIEVKLSDLWLKRYLERYGFDNSLMSLELISYFIQNSQSIIHKHICKTCFSGTYYKLEEAIYFIQHSSIKRKYKEILIICTKLIAKHHSYQLAAEMITQNYGFSKATLKRALQALSNIGINPVTIGKNRSHSCLEGLHEILGITKQ